MTGKYKRKLIRRVEKLLLKSKSPLLDVVVDFGLTNPRTGEVRSLGPLTLRELIFTIIDMEL